MLHFPHRDFRGGPRDMTETRRERFTKRDRAARLTRVWTLLYQHRPYGIAAQEIARRVNSKSAPRIETFVRLRMSLASPYRKIGGRWLCTQGDFLPPLKLSLLEAVTLFLSARLMARVAGKKDPHVVSAFSKLASVLPTPLAAHASTRRWPRCRKDRSIDDMRGVRDCGDRVGRIAQAPH